jgi:hypothetical protein
MNMLASPACARGAVAPRRAASLRAAARPAAGRRMVCNAGALEVPAEFTKVR